MIVSEIFSRFGFKLDKNSMRTVEKAQQGVARAGDRAAKRVGGLSSALGGASGALARFAPALTLGAAAIGGKRLAELAGDAKEAASLIGVVFGDGADDFNRFTERLAQDTGRSVFELRQLGSVFQAAAKGLLGDTQVAQTATENLIERGVDLASAYNTDVTEAINALRSGLAGETEPLRRFGVIMTQASLDAFALEKGIGKTVKAMTEQEKAALRVQFILSKNQDTIGDAARTAGSLTNRMRALQARGFDLLTRAGLALEPVFQKILDVAELLLGVFEGLGSIISKVWVVIQPLLSALASVAAALGVVGVALVAIKGPAIAAALAFAGVTAPAWLLPAAIAAIIAGLALLQAEFDAWVAGADSTIFDSILRGWLELDKAISGAWQSLKDFVSETGRLVGGSIVDFASSVLDLGIAPQSASASPAAQSAAGSVSQRNEQTVNVSVVAADGQSPRAVGAAVAQQVSDSFQPMLNEANRATAL